MEKAKPVWAVEAISTSRGLCSPLEGAGAVLGSAPERGVRSSLVLPCGRRRPGVALRFLGEETVVSALWESSVSSGGQPRISGLQSQCKQMRKQTVTVWLDECLRYRGSCYGNAKSVGANRLTCPESRGQPRDGDMALRSPLWGRS